MKEQKFNFLPGHFGDNEINALNTGDKKNLVDNSVNHAFYFLTIMLIMIMTFSLFRVEVLRLLLQFSQLW